MRTYRHDCWVKYVPCSDPSGGFTGCSGELSYSAGRDMAELWWLEGEAPWLLDINLLYRFTFHDTVAYDSQTMRLQRQDGDRTLRLYDDDYIVSLDLDELAGFLAMIHREPALTLRHPLRGTVTLAGHDTEHDIDACLKFSSDCAGEITLDFGRDYGTWDCDRTRLAEAFDDESIDGQLIIGPVRYQRLPIIVHSEDGQPDFTVEVESSEVEDFLQQAFRLVPGGEERRYEPDRFEQELSQLLVEGNRKESDEPPSPENQL
jgi:hypothetical protein